MRGGPACDVLVVGGGVNGVGIARDAAGRGLSVLLCEKDDLASHTSSWSSKLVHGGLRYLEYYEFRLVREALIERELLLRAAPNLIRPLTFVLPHVPEMRPAWLVRLGLFLYDHLGGREILPGSASVDLAKVPEGAPLKPDFARGFTYSDAFVDDARLVAVNAVDAAERGATILTRTKCTGAVREADGWRVTLEGPEGRREVRGKSLVNAAGPWVSAFLKGELRHDTRSRVRLVKGSHIVVPRLFEHGRAYILQNVDKRIVFAIPYLDRFTLVGTTDEAFTGDLDDVRITPEEEDYLCRVVNRYFRQQITPADAVWSYAGVRPLYDDASGNPSAVTRDYVFDLDAADGKPPLLSVFGGKLTTYRKLAEHALGKLQPVMGFREAPWTAKAHLPGGDIPNADFDGFLEHFKARHPRLDQGLVRRLARAYGTRAERVVDGAKGPEGLGREIAPGLYEAELAYLVRDEWARTAEDVLWRRSKLGLFADTDAQARVRAWMERRVRVGAAEVVA